MDFTVVTRSRFTVIVLGPTLGEEGRGGRVVGRGDQAVDQGRIGVVVRTAGAGAASAINTAVVDVLVDQIVSIRMPPWWRATFRASPGGRASGARIRGPTVVRGVSIHTGVKGRQCQILLELDSPHGQSRTTGMTCLMMPRRDMPDATRRWPPVENDVCVA